MCQPTWRQVGCGGHLVLFSGIQDVNEWSGCEIRQAWFLCWGAAALPSLSERTELYSLLDLHLVTMILRGSFARYGYHHSAPMIFMHLYEFFFICVQGQCRLMKKEQ